MDIRGIMKKVLLLALALSSTHVVRANEVVEETSEYEILTKIGAAVVALGAVGAVLYASQGDVVGALRSVTAGTSKVDLPKPGFSKKALALTGVVAFGAGMAAVGAVGGAFIGTFVNLPGHRQLMGHAEIAERTGHPDHTEFLMRFAVLLQRATNFDNEAGAFARFMLAHMNFFYSPVAKCTFGKPVAPPVPPARPGTKLLLPPR